MKIKSDRTGSVTTHTRTVEVEDGPVVGAGDSYIDGTYFKVEKIRIRWIDDNPAATVSLFGNRCYADGSKYESNHPDIKFISHQVNLPVDKGLPQWLKEFAQDNRFYLDWNHNLNTDGGHRRLM